MIVFQVPFTTAGTVLIIDDIESQNYVPGSTGWAIFANGDAEFGQLTARGTFISGSGSGKHIVINGSAGVIELWTGDPAQELPGSIGATSSVGSLMQTEISAPRAPGGAAPFITFVSVDSDPGATADSINLFASHVTMGDALYVETQELWHNLALNNTWAAFGGRTPQYRKTASGDVRLRGLVTAGTAGSVIATLPVGYRPTQQVDIGLKSNNDANTYSWSQVRTNGDIISISNLAAAAVWCTLDLSFSTL